MKTKQVTWRWAWSIAAVLCTFMAAALPLKARADTVVESVTSQVQGGVEVVRIDFSQPLAAVPAGFAIQSPARIALDVPGASNGLGRNTIEMNTGNVRSVNVVQAGERTRVVLNLKAAAAYRAQLQGKSLLVVLGPAAAGGPPPAAAPVFAESHNTDVQPIRDVDFRRGSDNSGRIVVTLPNNEVGVDIRQQGKNLVVDLLKSSLPEGLRRRLDVSDFGTPVNTATASGS
jgi:type IV pilus assembly protein PilQ